jgi:hypothetical protein
VARTGQFPEWNYPDDPPPHLLQDMVNAGTVIAQNEGKTDPNAEPEIEYYEVELSGTTYLIEADNWDEAVDAAVAAATAGPIRTLEASVATATTLQAELESIVDGPVESIFRYSAQFLAWDFTRLPGKDQIAILDAAMAEVKAAAAGDWQALEEAINNAASEIDLVMGNLLEFQAALADSAATAEVQATITKDVAFLSLTALALAYSGGTLAYSPAVAAGLGASVSTFTKSLATETGEAIADGNIASFDGDKIAYDTVVAAVAAGFGAWFGGFLAGYQGPLVGALEAKFGASIVAAVGVEARVGIITCLEWIVATGGSGAAKLAIQDAAAMIEKEGIDGVTWEKFTQCFADNWEQRGAEHMIIALLRDGAKAGM